TGTSIPSSSCKVISANEVAILPKIGPINEIEFTSWAILGTSMEEIGMTNSSCVPAKGAGSTIGVMLSRILHAAKKIKQKACNKSANLGMGRECHGPPFSAMHHYLFTHVISSS